MHHFITTQSASNICYLAGGLFDINTHKNGYFHTSASFMKSVLTVFKQAYSKALYITLNSWLSTLLKALLTFGLMTYNSH